MTDRSPYFYVILYPQNLACDAFSIDDCERKRLYTPVVPQGVVQCLEVVKTR